jgi:hypothetical protein
MSLENAKGTPIVAFIIVVVAVVLLGGFAFAFQGSIQF